jgi:hypothetical protein
MLVTGALVGRIVSRERVARIEAMVDGINTIDVSAQR